MASTKKRGCMYWFRLLAFGLVGGVTLACVGIEVFYLYVITRPADTSICCATPADYGLEYEEVTFTSQDGTRLSGWYIPSSNRAAVIFLHGFGANRTELLRHANALASHGYGVLLYDLRAHGQSQGRKRTLGWQDPPDAIAALDYLLTRPELDPARIGIFGFSVGGQIAIRAAAQDQRLSAIFADDPGFITIQDAPPPTNNLERAVYAMNWVDTKGMQIATGFIPQPPLVSQVIGSLSPRPLFLVATGAFPANARMGQHYYDLAGEPKTLWVIPEAGHGGTFSARPEEYAAKLQEFFDQALLEK
ncbi:MAG: alpha/beta fold hydrolase [Chloroflexota bacterium]